MATVAGKSMGKAMHRKVWDPTHLSEELLSDARPPRTYANGRQLRSGRGGGKGASGDGGAPSPVDRSLFPPTPPSSSNSHVSMALFQSPKYSQASDSPVRTPGLASAVRRPSQDQRRPSISSVASSVRSNGNGSVTFPQPPLRDAKMSHEAISRNRGDSNISSATVTSISSRRPASSQSPAIQACVLGDVTLRDEDDLLRDSLAIIDRDLQGRSVYSSHFGRGRESNVSGKSRATTVSAAGVQVWPVPLPPPPAALSNAGTRSRCPVHSHLLAQPECPIHGSLAGHSGYCPAHGYRGVQRAKAIPEDAEPPASQSFLESTDKEDEEDDDDGTEGDKHELDSVGHWTHSGSSRWSSDESHASIKDGHAQTIDAIVRQYQERISQQRLAEEQARRSREEEQQKHASTSRIRVSDEHEIKTASVRPIEKPQRPAKAERRGQRDEVAGASSTSSSTTQYPASSTSCPQYGEQAKGSSRIYRSTSSVWSNDSMKHPIPSRSSSVKSKVMRRPVHPPPLPFDTTIFAKHKSPLDALHASLSSYSTEASDLQRMRSDSSLNLPATANNIPPSSGVTPSSSTVATGASRSKSTRAAPVRWPMGFADRAKAKKIDTNAISSPLPVAIPTLPTLRPLPSFDMPLDANFGRKPRQPTPPTPTTAAAAAAAASLAASSRAGPAGRGATAAATSATAPSTADASSSRARTGTTAALYHTTGATGEYAYSISYTADTADSATTATTSARAAAASSSAAGAHTFTSDTYGAATTNSTAGGGSGARAYHPAAQQAPQEPWTATRRIISVKKDVELTYEDRMAIASRSPTREFQRGVTEGARRLSRILTPERPKTAERTYGGLPYSPKRVVIQDFDRASSPMHRPPARHQAQQPRGIRVLNSGFQRSPQKEYHDVHYQKASSHVQQSPGSRTIHFEADDRVFLATAATQDTQPTSGWGDGSYDSALEEGRAGQPRLYRQYKSTMRATKAKLKHLKLSPCHRQTTSSSLPSKQRRTEYTYESKERFHLLHSLLTRLRDLFVDLPPVEKAALGIAVTGLCGAVALIVIGVTVF